MKILAIQHDAADPPAHAGTVVQELGHDLTVVKLDRGDTIPATADADLLMTFGGAISLSDSDLPDWVAAEQDLIREYARTGRRVLGICLGSQMVAVALGATVQRNRGPEVGWHKVQPIGTADSAIAKIFAEESTVFHWHRDTFGIPDGADHILKSDGCDHQGFTIEDRIVGLQFHLEANEKTVNTFLFVSGLWRQDSPFVQSEIAITEGIQTHLPHQQELLEQVLEQLLA
ncbi:type 1 glutamine amidotransferase [Planctomycetes bacterium K23_9]|uniref:Glutamine amidotransferase n=1 Tax=Stieleria marina TaxID=1930275 RepID=A0A517NME7_9BACT|nr:glutamine amidotransferase [Planctomycetes bacterium K23_9]